MWHTAGPMQQALHSNGTAEADAPRVAETKRTAFKRLAEKRTNAILEKIRILSNCANPYVYEWDEEDVRKIFLTVDQELKLAKGRFQQAQRSRRQFKLQ
jgi:hypothetical protein